MLHLARSGRLILKASVPVKEGSILVDEKGRRTGKVQEIIGPASGPYLSAEPFTDRIERLVGTKLYLGEEVQRSKPEKKKREFEAARRGRPDRHSRGDLDKKPDKHRRNW